MVQNYFTVSVSVSVSVAAVADMGSALSWFVALEAVSFRCVEGSNFNSNRGENVIIQPFLHTLSNINSQTHS